MLAIRYPVFATLLTTVLWGCGGGGGGGSSTPPPAPPPQGATYTANSGVAQKGPLILGSTVTVQELSPALAATGKQYSYQTNSDLGTFNPSSTFTSQYIGVTATGRYFDEVTNTVSTGTITLQGYSDLTAAPVLNVNLLTTLAYQRIQNLVTAGSTFAAARDQAEREVLVALDIPGTVSVGTFSTLDLSQGREGDKLLAAISSIFAYGNDSANLAVLVANVQQDIGTNGRITSPATLATLKASAHGIDPAVVASNLNQRYATAGMQLTAADLGNWLDHDGDGVLSKFEFQVSDASQSSVFTLPADFVTQHDGASVSISTGRLSINGMPVTGAAEVHTGDAVTVSPAATSFPDGIFTSYVMVGSSKRARISFVSGLQSIAVTPADVSLPKGTTQQLQATGTFSDGSTADLTSTATWTSSSPPTASVATNGIVSANTLGSTTIAAASGTISGSTTITVLAPALESISLSRSNLSLSPGNSRQLTATGHYSDGTTGNLTTAATWSTGDTGLATVAAGLVAGVAPGTTTVTATSGSISATANLIVSTEFWTLAASDTFKASHTATLLANGKVLVAMGWPGGPCCNPTSATSLYDPIADTWSAAASTPRGVMNHTATLLNDGRVLTVGGREATAVQTGAIYDPVANTWTATASMSHARVAHTATLLSDGRVLIAGGSSVGIYSSAEIYDPVTDTWAAAPDMTSPRFGHAAIVLNNGKVLVVGGSSGNGVLHATAELYDPVADSWSPAGTMAETKYRPTATALPDGRVLVVGGSSDGLQRSTSVQIYDPVTNAWSSAASMTYGRYGHTAVALPNGTVMAIAGDAQQPMTAEVYDPATNTWLLKPDLLGYHNDQHTSTLLPSGAVLVIGGESATVEVYQ